MEFPGILDLITVLRYLASGAGNCTSTSGGSVPLRKNAPLFRGRTAATTTPDSDSARGRSSTFSQRIQAAIADGHDICFRYSDAKDNVTCRTIHERRFFEFEFARGEGRSLCVEHHCGLRNEPRTFALRLMSELETL